MKKLFLLLLIPFGSMTAYSQFESEPNNSFGAANNVLEDVETTASVGGPDTDHFKATFNYSANFRLIIEATNTGGSTQPLLFQFYNGLTMPGPILNPQLQHTENIMNRPISPGETVYDTILVCGFAADNYYLRFSSSGTFEYIFKWDAVNVTTIDGDNNTRATARSFTYNVLRQGNLGYEFWGNVTFDTVNYFKSVLPAGDYSTRRLYLVAQNNACFMQAWVRYALYKNDEVDPFASGFLANISSLGPLEKVNQSFSLSNMTAGDSIFVKWSSNGPIEYSMIYREPGGNADQEDNCCTYNAYYLEEDEIVGGNVGTYDWNEDIYVDEFDTYQFTMPHYGGITIELTASTAECNDEYYGFDIDLLDEAGSEVNYIDGVWWDSYPPCNDQQTRTIYVYGLVNRRYYLRLRSHSPGKVNYSFRYNITDSTTRFDAEQNNSTGTAIPLAPGQVVQGNVRFHSSVIPDGNDYYLIDVPADGKLAFNITSRYLGSNETGNNNSSKLQVEVVGRVTSVYSPGGTPPVLIPGTTYSVNPVVCAVGAGINYLRVTSGSFTPQEYELSYDFIDTSSLVDREPNNHKATATVMPGGETRNGSIYYYYNGSVDTEDNYKMVFSSTDSLVLFVSATNTSCVTGRRIRFSAVNKNNVSLFNRYIANNMSVADGQTIYDTVRMRIVGPDTIYIRFYDDVNTGAFRYTLTTKALPPYSLFRLDGDTTVCVSTQVYVARGIPETNVNYHWSLPDGGGTFTFVDSTITVNWTEPGNRRIQLYLSNPQGTSAVKNQNVVVNGIMPTQTPVAYNFARTLSTNSLPPGAHCQWYKDGGLIPGATDSTYYAADAGSFTVRFTNDCGTSPESNAIVFGAAAQSQSITFPQMPDMLMAPNLKVGMTASASSNLPVYYQKLSGPGTIINDTLFITGTGTTIVRALQPGDDVYSAATPVNDTIVISKGNQVISFDPVPDQVYDNEKITLIAGSSAGLNISYSIIAGSTFASVSGNKITKKGAGTVTVRATQNGNGNYNPAAPVERSFCIGVRTIGPITGDPNPCINTYRYLAQRIPGANYVWTLSGGGILTTNLDTAWVQWQTPGSYTLSVKANSPCDPQFSNTIALEIETSSNAPVQVSGMLPIDHTQDAQLPLKLSWIPGTNTVNYDLYIWDSAQSQPAIPFASNINGLTYTIPKNALVHNTVYKWRVVSKNPCQSTSGLIQHFRVLPLPDLVVSNVQAPAIATSGQTITVSWTVTNIGPGSTLPGSSWADGVYFSFDTTPNFRGSIDWNPYSWNSVTSNGRPLLLGKKERPTGLGVGQAYTNSIDFTLPLNYSFPVYIYVITNNQNQNYPIAQASVANDTARKQDPMVINLAPTPDLRVDSIFAPAVTFSGSTINIAYKVKNYGVMTPGGSNCVDSFFLSQSPLFDRSLCIPLHLPKTNHSYYPNAVPAHLKDNSQILADQTVTRSVDVVIPNFILGTWFIYVKTNANTAANGFIYEGPLSTNNEGQKQIEIYLTPTPKLVVNSLQVPVTTASTTQPIGINYNIKNQGFSDNIERNKGHYLVRMIDRCPCHAPSGCNCVCTGSPVYMDSLVLGSSHWLERIYLSTDPSGLNTTTARLVKEVKHDSANAGIYYADNYTKEYQCASGAAGALNVKHALNPGANFPMNVGFNIPENLEPGDYYLYVYTNPTKTVFEYPGTPQIKRSDLPINIQRPDVSVPALTVPPAVTGGLPVTINYEVLNSSGATVFNHIRHDQLYVSNFPVFDASAQVVSTQTYTEDIPAGNSKAHSFAYTFPAATTGNKYFYVRVNYDSAFRETNYVNNLSASALTVVSAAVPADLVVTTVQPQDSVFTIFNSYLQYEVANNGTGTVAGNWRDSIFISCNPVFSTATSYFVAARNHGNALASGETYRDTVLLQLKMAYELLPCFPQQMYGTVYFFVKTNANNGAYEASATTNNSTGSTAKVLVNPLVDHVVTSVSAPDIATVGHPYQVTWKTRNLGYKPIYPFNQYTYYYDYRDAIYLSTDSVLDAADVLVDAYLKYVLLNRDEEKQDTRSPAIPNVPSGNYYLIVKSNMQHAILAELTTVNNTNLIREADGTPKQIQVIKPLLPDLTDSILSMPSEVPAGQPITIKYRVTNDGLGATYPTTWKNTLRLSTDFFANPNDGDRVLHNNTRSGELAPGAWFEDSVTVVIPVNTPPGNYVIIGYADSDKKMVEEVETNNLGFGLLSVLDALQADLVVDKVRAPDTVYLGYTIDTVKWEVGNLSSHAIKGTIKDGIYLTTAKAWDSSAVLLGVKDHKIDFEPLETDSSAMTALAHSVVEGEYYVMAVTDVLSAVADDDRTNNYNFSATPIYVKVKELLLETNEYNTLQQVDRYYKLRIPDTLIGATIRVTLKTSDSLTVRNEMFIAGGYIPSPAQYDYAFEIPNSGNQRIVMADVTDSIYYIRVRSVSPNPPVQSITLRADVLPFAILDVNSASGANIGNVTVKISGSLFEHGMTARLTRGSTVKTAVAVYYTNSTSVFATFALQGAPLGLYDVTLIKQDGTETTMPDGFSIVLANNGGLITGSGPNTGGGNGNEPGCYPGTPSGLNSQLAIQLVVPPSVILGRPMIIQIHFSNPTNFDIPVQTRTLYSEDDMRMAFTREGVPGGTTALHIEFSEPGGPPGIIRPGGSGTILVYTRAPGSMPPDPIGWFTLQ